MKKEKIYKYHCSCALCSKIVEDYDKYTGRTIRAWYVICLQCYKDFVKRIEKLEKKVFKQ